MFAKTTGALVVVALIVGVLIARDERAPVKVGDRVFLRLTGDLAVTYSRLEGLEVADGGAPVGLQIEMEATIAQQTKDGQFRIENVMSIFGDDGKPGLVTLSSVVAKDQIREILISAGPRYASPTDTKPVHVTTATRGLRVELSELKSTKLCSWSLVEEIGE